MTFTTKTYTRPVLLKALRKVNVNKYTDLNTLASALSPRAGIKSAKVAAITKFMTRRQISSLFKNGNTVFSKRALISVVKNS